MTLVLTSSCIPSGVPLNNLASILDARKGISGYYVTAPTSVKTNICSSVKVGLLNFKNEAMNAPAETVVDLASTGTSIAIYSNGSCSAQIRSVTIPSGVSEVTVYFNATVAENVTISAQDPNRVLSSVTKPITITNYCASTNVTALDTMNVCVDAAAAGGGDGSAATPLQTIAAGVAAAASGGIVYVAGGGYAAETITLSSPVTIQGSGSGVTGTDTVLTGAGAGTAFTMSGGASSAARVSIRDMRITNYIYGVNIGSYSTLYNITSTAHATGLAAGARINTLSVTEVAITSSSFTSNVNGMIVENGANVTNLIIHDSHFDSNTNGIYLQKSVWDYPAASTIADTSTVSMTVTSSSMSNNTQKGLYAEKMSDTTFSNLTINTSGSDAAYGFNAGMDINLKFADYSNISITNSSITNSGALGSAIAGSKNPTALTIKGRDDGAVYGAHPATLTTVTLSNLVVSGIVNGIRIGEAAQNNLTPTGFTLTNSSITGPNYAFDNERAVATGAIDISNNYWQSANGPCMPVNQPGCVGFGNPVTDVPADASTLTISSFLTAAP